MMSLNFASFYKGAGVMADRGGERRSGAFGASTTQVILNYTPSLSHNDLMQPSLLEVPNMKSYHTPSVPRKHARLQV